MQGLVEIQKKNQAEWKTASAKTVVKNGDRIRTGEKSLAVTVTEEGHGILIKEGTLFEIVELGPVEWNFKQEMGKTQLSIVQS